MRLITFNSRRAQELGKWAEALGKGDEFRKVVFKAYFADGKNIAKFLVLKEIPGQLALMA
jgi:predicted DsbA family dithiol-disulfide isomerase